MTCFRRQAAIVVSRDGHPGRAARDTIEVDGHSCRWFWSSIRLGLSRRSLRGWQRRGCWSLRGLLLQFFIDVFSRRLRLLTWRSAFRFRCLVRLTNSHLITLGREGMLDVLP